MYLSHYGLKQAPFGITPNPAFFFTGNNRGAILEALIYAVKNGEGIIKVTGEVGSGKTMLCRMLESMLPAHIEVIYLVNPTLGKEEVIYAIAGELGLDTRDKRPDEVIRLLQSELIAKHVAGKQVVLLVEEAQAMPLDTLEEIRLFSNLETAHHKLLQIVLFGQPELDEHLRLPRMRQLKERITHSFPVPPMEASVIPEYLMFRMRAAGYHGPDIFTKGAIKQLTRVSEGVVRRISILADKSLLAAFAENTHAIEARHVKAAIRDSEFATPAATTRRRYALAGLAALCLIGLIATWKLISPNLSSPAAAPALNSPALPTASPQAPATVAPTITTKETRTSHQTRNTIQAATAFTSQTPTKAATPAANVAVTPQNDLLQRRLAATQAWISNGTAQPYTVQIRLADAQDRSQFIRLLEKLESQFSPSPLYVFPSKSGAGTRYNIAVGSYISRAEAQAAINRFSSQFGYQPQLRTLSGIRQEVGYLASRQP